jgi:bifunctional non-homologous end joining protein LigD
VFNRSPFIPPAQPVLRPAPPRGDAWVREVKFDGWLIQLHKHRNSIAIYTRSGADFTHRLRAIAEAVASLPVRSIVIDGELTACDKRGLPDFRSLHFRGFRTNELCVWAFDVLWLDNTDIRPAPLTDRKRLLESIVNKTGDNWLRFSETFNEGEKLLKAAERMGLEGVVSKRRDVPYRSGIDCGWIKVKCQSWKDANKDRGELFNRRKRLR